jgi:tRNA(adenine34) deaminase
MKNIINEKYMIKALRQATLAEKKNEVPVGAVLISETGEVVSSAYNRVIGLSDPTAHAEILALRKAAKKVMNYRLLNTTLYVTVEPCVMCMGAIIHARVKCVVFGAKDPKWGACGSLYHLADDRRFNHHPEIIGGFCEDACKTLVQNFFRGKRNRPGSGFDQHRI